MSLDGNIDPHAVRNALYLAAPMAVFIALPLIREGVSKLSSYLRREEKLTGDEREFLEGLDANERLVSSVVAFSDGVGPTNQYGKELINRIRVHVESSLGGYRTLGKRQEQISEAVRERFGQFKQSYEHLLA